MAMKLIFLDIDGVLNNQLFYVQNLEADVRKHIDPRCISLLNNLCSTADAKVIVISTWRLGRSVEELQQLLDEGGFTGEVIDKTLDMRRGENGDCILRGNEVLQWIKAHPAECGKEYWEYKEYVIFDDDSDFLYWQRDNLVLCDPFVGLSPQSIFKAKKILNISSQ